MKKALFSLIFFIFLSLCTNVFADDIINEEDVKVFLVVEGHDDTILKSSTFGYTFYDAITNASKQNVLDVLYKMEGSKKYVYSVNGTENNKFLQNDRWLGYIIRKGEIIKPQDFLSFTLNNNDQIVLYYGSFDNTKIINKFDLLRDNNIFEFVLNTRESVKSKTGDEFDLYDKISPVIDAKIRIKNPAGTLKILKTNEYGKTSTKFDLVGIYEYYAEHYVSESYPLLVKTNTLKYFYTDTHNDILTRAQFASFCVNTFSLEKGEIVKVFNDVSDKTKYKNDIYILASKGIVSGYSDSSFRPSENLKTSDFLIIAKNLGFYDKISERDLKNINKMNYVTKQMLLNLF